MKQSQSPRRARGRGKRNNTPSKSNDGVTGEAKLKGNPKQLLDKYKSLAKDALQSGDRILAEGYFQHADHYQRVINERAGRANGILRDPKGGGRDEADGGQGQSNGGHHKSERASRGGNGRDPAEEPQPREERDEREVPSDSATAKQSTAAGPSGKSKKPDDEEEAGSATDSSTGSDAAA